MKLFSTDTEKEESFANKNPINPHVQTQSKNLRKLFNKLIITFSRRQDDVRQKAESNLVFW